MLEGLGCAVLSADAVVHEIQTAPETVAALAERFGEEVVPNGVLDRKALASAVFAEQEDRAWLERLIWPKVGERITAWVASLDGLAVRPHLAVVEVPLLFESGMESGFDATICILADEQLRARRAAGRGHESVDERERRQLSQAEKARRSDWVVINDGTVDELARRLSEVVDSIAG